jgi:hypothetical protein
MVASIPTRLESNSNKSASFRSSFSRHRRRRKFEDALPAGLLIRGLKIGAGLRNLVNTFWIRARTRWTLGRRNVGGNRHVGREESSDDSP